MQTVMSLPKYYGVLLTPQYGKKEGYADFEIFSYILLGFMILHSSAALSVIIVFVIIIIIIINWAHNSRRLLAPDFCLSKEKSERK